LERFKGSVDPSEPVDDVFLIRTRIAMTTTQSRYDTYRAWAENARFGELSPKIDGRRLVKMRGEHGDVQEVEVREIEGHPVIAHEGEILYWNPRAGFGETRWVRYEDLPNPAFPRVERFDLSTHNGREGYRRWLRTILSESAATWDRIEDLDGLLFEEYFEPYLCGGILYNDTSFEVEEAIVAVSERAISIYEDVREEVVAEEVGRSEYADRKIVLSTANRQMSGMKILGYDPVYDGDADIYSQTYAINAERMKRNEFIHKYGPQRAMSLMKQWLWREGWSSQEREGTVPEAVADKIRYHDEEGGNPFSDVEPLLFDEVEDLFWKYYDVGE
jgi:hypothetical protein